MVAASAQRHLELCRPPFNCNIANFGGSYNECLQAIRLRQQPGANHLVLPRRSHELLFLATQAVSMLSANDLPYHCPRTSTN